MRQAIQRALLRVLESLFPAQGRHSGRFPPVPLPVNPWALPWTTPTPQHIIDRHTPLRGEDCAFIRPYAPLDDTIRLRPVRTTRPRRVLIHAPTGLNLRVPPAPTSAVTHPLPR
ncbi:hypothetical protein [Streptomyces sp. NPDC020965]|uniref:hypothetical protein n=1 Tax=Streptomyces sp. NPDC020965 TaxID=3365105 RepID=UPI0037AC196C